MLTEPIEVQIFRFLIQTQTADKKRDRNQNIEGCGHLGTAVQKVEQQSECSNNQGMFKLSGSSVLGRSYIWILTVKEFRRDRKLG